MNTIIELVRELIRLGVVWACKRPVVGFGLALCGILGCLRLISAILGLLFAGASATTTDVSGQISLNGVPVKEGTLQFLPKDSGQPARAVIRDGRFKAENVAIGPCRVVCVAIKETGKEISEGGHVFPERVSLVPEAYRDGVDITIQPHPKELVLDWSKTK